MQPTLQTQSIPKAAKYALSVLGALIFVASLVRFNLGETVAFWWHIRHGFHARCCGVEVEVPLAYWGSDDDNGSVNLSATPGYFRSELLNSPHASISIRKNLPALNAEHLQMASDRMTNAWAKHGYQLREKRVIQMAGSTLSCTDLHTEHFDVLGPNDQIYCFGTDKYASFFGSPGLRDEFYSILTAAKVVEH